jgi:hypothetical protein
MFCNFCLVKNHKLVSISATAEVREKNKHQIRILGIFEKIDLRLTKS